MIPSTFEAFALESIEEIWSRYNFNRTFLAYPEKITFLKHYALELFDLGSLSCMFLQIQFPFFLLADLTDPKYNCGDSIRLFKITGHR